MTRRIIPAVVAALLAATAIALAGNTTFFTNIGDVVFPFVPPGQNGANGSIGDPTSGGMAPVNGVLSYKKCGGACTTADYTFGPFQQELAFTNTNAGTLSSQTITLTANPVDGAKNCFFSATAITTLTVSPSAGQSIGNAATTLAANGRTCYLYSKGNTTWDRVR